MRRYHRRGREKRGLAPKVPEYCVPPTIMVFP
jgi:hypothetical protein